MKLASVLKDVQGKSAQKLLDGLAAGQPLEIEDVSQLIYKSLRPKLDEITLSVESVTTPLQRAMLGQMLDHIDDLNRRVTALDEMVEQYMAGYVQSLEAIDEIPGVALQSAQVVLAEIGQDMDRFPSAAHICSWAGVCPGNHRSAGKRKHGRTNRGNKTLKSMLVQCTKAARNVKDSYFSAQYQHIAARRGNNRATMAVAHSILTAIWYILKYKVPYHDLGADYFDSIHKEQKIRSYLKRLKALGWDPEAPAVAASA